MHIQPHLGHDGTELLLEEIREETRRLVTHPVREVVRLEHVAVDGESAATPMIVVAGVALAGVALIAVFLGIAALATGLYG